MLLKFQDEIKQRLNSRALSLQSRRWGIVTDFEKSLALVRIQIPLY